MQDEWVGLARRAREGEIDAFAMLVERFKRPLCASVQPILRDWHLAQDVAQEAFTAVHARLFDLDRSEHFRSYLFRVAHHLAVSKVRTLALKRARSLHSVREQDVTGYPRGGNFRRMVAPSRSGLDLSSGTIHRIREAITSLPNGYGTLLTLRYLEGMGITEIGEVVGKSSKAVKAALYRARLMARKVLRRAGLDLEAILDEV